MPRQTAKQPPNRQSATPTRQSAQRPQMSNDERRRLRAERARKQKKRRTIVLALVFTAFVLTIGVTLCLTVLFHVSSISVSGDTRYEAEQVVSISGINVGENMFLIPTKKVAETIERTLPYVESVKLKRSPSGAVELVLYPATVGAAVQQDGEQYFLLSTRGKVLEEAVTELPKQVPVFIGGAISSAVVGQEIVFQEAETLSVFQNFLELLASENLTGVTQIDLTDKSNVQLVFDNRIHLKLGTLSSIEKKMNFVKATLAHNAEDTPDFRGEIDFTIDKNATVRPEKTDETEKNDAAQ